MTPPPDVRVAWRRLVDGRPRRDVSRALLAELLPGATFASRCPRCGGAHGRVRVTGANAVVSVSYAAGWAVVAAAPSDRVRAIGVDAAPSDATGWERVADGGARAWTRIEAVLKLDGRGLDVDPRRVHVDEGGASGPWRARIDDADAVTGWDVAGPPGVVVSVAVRPAASVRLG